MAEFGLIGHPVAHSMSKVMHEAAFRVLGLSHTYGLYDVTPEKLQSFMGSADFLGLNVTVPHKVSVVPYMDGLSEEAKLIGSVNTIAFAGKKMGHNTDALGFVKALQEAGVGINGRKFLVVGAGGGGRGIVFKLAMEKAKVFCHNRDPMKSHTLADEVSKKTGRRVVVPESIAGVIGDVDVLVNATSVGMSPNTDATVLPRNLLRPNLTVVDIVYNPIRTRLLQDAQAAGCKTVDGVGMLVHQGAESLRIWLGVDPPIDAMRGAVLAALKKTP